MEPQVLEEQTINKLTETLLGELKKSLDARDTTLMERVGKTLDEKIKVAQEEAEKLRTKFQVPGVGHDDTKKFSIAKLLKARLTKNYSDCGFELEMCKAAAQLQNTENSGMVARDMSTGIDSAGGFIVPQQVLENEFIPLLQAQAIAFALGVRQIGGLTGSPVPIGKVTGATTAYWVGEAPSSGVTESDMAFGQIELRPRTLAATTKLSNRLIRMSSPAAESLVRQQLSKDMALAMDLAIFNGSGVSNQPKGILQESGINTVTSFGAASATTAYNALIDMIYKVELSNALMGSLGWACHPAVIREFQKMLDKDSSGSQPKERRLFDSLPINVSLLGYSFKTSTQLPTNTLIFGDWSQEIVGFWTNGMEFKVSDVAGNNMDRLQTQILVALDMDIACRQPTAFCANTDMSGAS